MLASHLIELLQYSSQSCVMCVVLCDVKRKYQDAGVSCSSSNTLHLYSVQRI